MLSSLLGLGELDEGDKEARRSCSCRMSRSAVTCCISSDCSTSATCADSSVACTPNSRLVATVRYCYAVLQKMMNSLSTCIMHCWQDQALGSPASCVQPARCCPSCILAMHNMLSYIVYINTVYNQHITN